MRCRLPKIPFGLIIHGLCFSQGQRKQAGGHRYKTGKDGVIANVKALEEKVNHLSVDLQEIKDAQAKHGEKIKALEESSQFNDDRLNTAEANIEKAKVVSKEYTDAVKKDLLYLETYSRRENLKFAGIPEQLMEVEGSEPATAEDTRKVLQDFLQEQLGITSPERIEFQRIHRLGKKKERPRMIIARFLRYGDRERIIREAFKLKDTDYKIYEDIPQELLDERKKLLPVLRKAKKEGKRAFFSKAQPDKLIINGQIYSP
ncbi:uncharacterized protein LOC144659258 [Oculina patagonica]